MKQQPIFERKQNRFYSLQRFAEHASCDLLAVWFHLQHTSSLLKMSDAAQPLRAQAPRRIDSRCHPLFPQCQPPRKICDHQKKKRKHP